MNEKDWFDFGYLFERLTNEGHIVFLKGDGLRTSAKYTVFIDNNYSYDASTPLLALECAYKDLIDPI